MCGRKGGGERADQPSIVYLSPARRRLPRTPHFAAGSRGWVGTGARDRARGRTLEEQGPDLADALGGVRLGDGRARRGGVEGVVGGLEDGLGRHAVLRGGRRGDRGGWLCCAGWRQLSTVRRVGEWAWGYLYGGRGGRAGVVFGYHSAGPHPSRPRLRQQVSEPDILARWADGGRRWVIDTRSRSLLLPAREPRQRPLTARAMTNAPPADWRARSRSHLGLNVTA